MMVIKNATVRKTLRIILPFVAAPAVALIGSTVFGDKVYAFTSMTLCAIAVLLFICSFEKRTIGTRRAVIVAVMIALSVVGRFIPLFKPVSALTIISALYLGGECGFLVGAMSALISNFYFGQGPWTPFQMLAWGFVGLLAGMVAAPLKRNRVLLCIFGVASGILFSLIMDIWTVVWYNNGFDGKLYFAAFLTAVPHTIMYAFSNVVFLWLTAKPIGEKMERIKIKYGV